MLLGQSALWTSALSTAVLGLGIIGGFGNLALRQPAAATARS